LKFKFHIVPQTHELVRYQHESVALCEGLQELGYEFYGSDDYWYEIENNSYLIKKAGDDFKSDVNVYSTFYFRAFPSEISKVDYSKINIFIDREDGLYGEYGNPNYKKFDLILRTHYNKNINYNYYNKNIKPWAFGLSNRIINAIDKTYNEPIIDRTLITFRIAHDLRGKAVDEMSATISKKHPLYNAITINIENKDAITLSEIDKSYWLQSGHRHDPSYYKLLNSSLITYSFGGFIFTKPFATNRIVRQFQSLYKLKAAVLQKLNVDNSSCYFINQFDSWRLWESFYAKTCPIHMDFDDWQWVLPVMPINKIHYWGVPKFNFIDSAQELLSLNNDAILKIANAGRNWALENYNSKATALRFIEMINKL